YALQVDGLRKVYEIFTSLSVDPGVKKSAVDQLAIILQVALLLSNDDRTCYEVSHILALLLFDEQARFFMGFSAKLRLTPTDKIILTNSHLRQGLQSAVYDITNSTSHFAVQRSLRRLLGYLVARSDAGVMEIFHTLDWCGAVARFVKVTPASTADESLLWDILRFISLVLKLTNRAPDNILQWVGEVLYHPKALLAFISAYNNSLPYLLTVRLKFHQLRGDLAHRLVQRLNVTDAPHFYNLAALEATLLALVHITARPGWSQECTDQEGNTLLCQVLNCLLEVVCAFHIGRGGTAMSFMGKGEWPKNWLYSRHGDDMSGDPGLDWMLTLWAYRDSEVRTAGLGIAVTLSCLEEGRKLLTANCKHIPGGIWAAALSILLDTSECSIVRQQAALLLVNLTSTPLPSGTSEGEQRIWAGPIVMDTEYGVSLTGLPALLALVEHCQLYREMTVMLSAYHPQPAVQPTLTSEIQQLSQSASENTLSVLGGAESSGEECPGEITTQQSVTTPCLVAAVSQLVRNLIVQAPQDTVTALKNESLIPFFVSMLDAGFLEGIQGLTSSVPMELFFTELLEMHVHILRLLNTCLVHDHTTRLHVLQDRVALGGIVSLLRIFSDVSADTYGSCCEVWNTVLMFLTTLVKTQCGAAVEVLGQVLTKQWTPIAEALLRILEGGHGKGDLYTACLDFLSALCSEEGKLGASRTDVEGQVTFTVLLNSPQHADGEEKDGGHVTAGSSFCKALITSCDQIFLRKGEHSQTGERIHTHSRLSMTSLQSKQGSKVKDEALIQELTLTLDLLRNFMYKNEDVKTACYHSGLHHIVHKLWSWCQLDIGLMACVVSLLTTYTASSPTAGSSGLSPNSLVHAVVKYTSKNGHKEHVQRGLFSLLANLALSSECRNILWKSNFLQEFSNLNPKRSKGNKGRQLATEQLWLELLINLSFSLEGQQIILKIPACLDVLLEFVESPTTRLQETAVMIIRNLACHTSNKPRLLSNDQLLPRLLVCVGSDREKVTAGAASALWALIYNNQKAKVVMKNANVAAKLQDIMSDMDATDSKLQESCLADLQAVIATRVLFVNSGLVYFIIKRVFFILIFFTETENRTFVYEYLNLDLNI
ncbi:RTTN-like protein, partial [Mya arenaria]